jgi:acylglycerol lipase
MLEVKSRTEDLPIGSEWPSALDKANSLRTHANSLECSHNFHNRERKHESTMKLHPHTPHKYGFDGESPPMVPEEHKNEGHFSPSFDKRLWMFHRRWEPPTNVKVKATLMIVHGTVDHSGVYAELAKELVSAGIAVFAIDMRGWGLSDGESMYLDSMDTSVADVDALYQEIHSLPRYEKVKSRFLLGKSIGGTITTYCIHQYPQHWTGLLGLSGAYKVDPKLSPSPLVLAILNGAAKLIPKTPVKQLFDEHLIVRDEAALQAWMDDTLCCKDKVRIGYIVVGTESLYGLPGLAAGINLPMLMMYGDADKVVTKAGHELMIQNNQHTDKQLKLYPEGYHNLLAEPSLKVQVTKDIKEWIVAHA